MITPDSTYDWRRKGEHVKGDPVSGDGWADPRDEGHLEDEISYHNGDET